MKTELNIRLIDLHKKHRTDETKDQYEILSLDEQGGYSKIVVNKELLVNFARAISTVLELPEWKELEDRYGEKVKDTRYLIRRETG